MAFIQSNIDQGDWNGRRSLFNLIRVTDTLVSEVKDSQPDLIVFPESGIYTYLTRDRYANRKVHEWSILTNSTMIFGTLHQEMMSNDPNYKFRVYNSVFMLKRATIKYEMYHKIKLVPFSEALPFEGMFPLLSRVNLGESDFKKGSKEQLFKIENDFIAAPYLCYEIIYPNFVRRRVKAGANILINLTNDGWFGRSTAPYLHADMARMRSIENGVPLVRCANSGFSLAADSFGRILKMGGLFKREAFIVNVPMFSIATFYRRFGDWFPISAAVFLGVMVILGAKKDFKK